MKRIAMSLGAITFVAALALGATGAFFTDQEKSTGNTFTAGSLDLTIDSQSHYDGLVCSEVTAGIFHWIDDPADATPTSRPELIDTNCDGTWSQTNLGPANKFFNFTDVKPGDHGEDTISMHVTNNAWMCANITTTSNNDNTVIAPEIAAGDNASSTAGELAQNTFVFGWVDNASSTNIKAGDNIWESGEQVLFAPIALSAIVGSSSINLPLADSQHGSALIASTTNYVGVAWCTGTMDVSVPGTIKCDGAGVGNIIQTDSATADITLTATQSRNNPTFLCGQGTTTTSTTGIVVTKIVVNNNGGTSTVASFPLFVDGGSVLSGATTTVFGGQQHLVSESGKTGYASLIGGDCAANGTVTVATGTVAHCTITNDDIAPTITLTKVILGNGPISDPAVFNLKIDGNSVSSGSTTQVNAGVGHALSETATSTYTGSVSGNAKCPAVVGGNTAILGLAENISCTITNTFIGS